MVVDDSVIEATMVKALLEAHGFTVEAHHSGDEAFKAALARPPIMVISDVMMPVMDGFEFCERLKSSPPLQEIPVILLTSLQDPLDIIHGLQSGANNFITKPFEPKYLLSRVNYLLANRELRMSGSSDMVLEIMFKGKKFAINSERKQILDLLLSVYETSVEQSRALMDAQQKLEATNQQLLQANRDLESFSYTISHDLRTPLNHIGMCAQLMKEKNKQGFDPEEDEYMGTIASTVQSMAEMIQNLLQFSRSGSVTEDRTQVDISAIAKEVIDQCRSDEPWRSLNLHIQDGIHVKGDRGLMLVVMKNLLGNAWKYCSKKAVTEIIVGSEQHEGSAVVFVRDNGAGFDTLKGWNLFTPFIRLHTQDEFPGTGIGLATVRRIIDRHGGRIWADSEVGIGSTFYFTIPE